jgi:CRP-like cAMP-binding protein
MSSPTDVVALLAATDLFGAISDSDRRDVADAMREERFDAGQTIFARDEAGGSGLYLFADGRVRLSVLNSDGRELTFRFVERGGIMGEIAALDGAVRTADALAVTGVRAYVLSQARLGQLMEQKASIARAPVRFVCARLRETSQQLEEIALHPIERRVARFLVSALRLAGEDLDRKDVPIDLKLTQAEMALLLGASRPKVNVALGALENDGALTRTGDRIVCHPPVLLRIAGFEEG